MKTIKFENRDRTIQKIGGKIDLTKNQVGSVEYVSESDYVRNL